MSNEVNTTSSNEAELTVEGFGEVEIDAIGEIENITMGAAATAVSNLLNAKVWITTPKVKVVKASDLQYNDLAPFVYDGIYEVMQAGLGEIKDYIVIGQGGQVTAAVKAEDLIRA